MKFSCSQSNLTKAINIVSKAVTSRTTMPILKGILLNVSCDGYLTMSASDLDIAITKKLNVEDFEEGATVVPAKLFSDIIRKLPNDTIYIENEDNGVLIQCLNSQFKLTSFPADEFPKIEDTKGEDEAEKYIKLKKETLKEMIRMTAFCASTDEQRKIMTGILMELCEGNFNMVASDGFRLALASTDISCDEEKNLIVPQKILSEIGKIIQESESDNENEELMLYISDKKAKFVIGDINVYTSLLNGEFLKYQNYIPNDNTIKLVVNRTELLDSIERASLMARVKKNNLIKLSLVDETIEITSNSEEGDARESINVKKEMGGELTIGFNSKYLSDALKAVNDDEVVMELKKSNNPCLIHPKEGCGYTYLVFPIRIQG